MLIKFMRVPCFFHKQFSLDRMAKRIGAFPTKVEAKSKGNEINRDDPPIVKDIDSIAWQFHNFTSGSKRQYVSPKKDKLEDVLVEDPRGGGRLFRDQSVDDAYAEGMINVSAAQKLLQILQQKGRDMAEEALSDLPELSE